MVRRFSGDRSLDQLQRDIRYVEVTEVAKFESSQIVNDANDATFEELGALGRVPDDLALRASDDAAPDGYSNIWQGPMLVENADTEITAYRES